MVAYPLLPQPLVHRGQRQFNGDAHIIPDAGGSRAGTAPEAIDGDDIRAAAGDPAGDGRNVVDGCHLDDDRLLVSRRLLQGIDQLPQILNGVNIMVGRG